MTLPGDHLPDMTRSSRELRRGLDHDLEALFEGGVDPNLDLQEVAAFLASLHRLAELPAPRPSPDLAAVLAHGQLPGTPDPPADRTVERVATSQWLRRGAVAVALGAGAAAALVGAAAASDRLPDGAQDAWVRMVEVITLFEAHSPPSPGPSVDAPGSGNPARVHGTQRPAPATTAPDENRPSAGGAQQSTGAADTTPHESDDDTDDRTTRSDDRPATTGDRGEREDETDDGPVPAGGLDGVDENSDDSETTRKGGDEPATDDEGQRLESSDADETGTQPGLTEPDPDDDPETDGPGGD